MMISLRALAAICVTVVWERKRKQRAIGTASQFVSDTLEASKNDRGFLWGPMYSAGRDPVRRIECGKSSSGKDGRAAHFQGYRAELPASIFLRAEADIAIFGQSSAKK
jgi:hypothetical protein